ncbi:hypothetical protein D9M68_739680 [compost metagenome]
MDAVFQRRDLHAFPAPFVGADHAQQLAQRRHIGLAGGAVGLFTGFAHIGRAAQRHAVVGLERQQQHAQRAGALRLRQPVQVEGLGGGAGRALGLLARPAGLLRLALGAPCHGVEQLARVLEVAAPQQGSALAGEPVGGVGAGGVVGDHHAARRRVAGLGAPGGAALGAVLGPVDAGQFAGGFAHGLAHSASGRRGVTGMQCMLGLLLI